MDAAILLAGLKVDLGLTSDAFNDRLLSRLRSAIEWIQAEGVTLTDSDGDKELVIMYAAWLWNSRKTGEGMPRMLRYAINNRVFGEKAGGA